MTMSPQGGAAQPVPLTLPPPFMRREAAIVGFNTRIGIGEVALITAQIALPPALCFFVPSRLANQVGVLLVILTRMRAEAATLAAGKLRLLRFTLDAVGKSTYTFVPKFPDAALL